MCPRSRSETVSGVALERGRMHIAVSATPPSQIHLPEWMALVLDEDKQVSQAEVQLLYERFQQLGPDKDGRLNRTVFQKPSYSTDPFSRQIWKRMSGETEAPNMITFPSFVRTMVWWQQAPIKYKLELMFTLMKDVDGITPELLARILTHVFPDYQQDELQQMAKQMVTMMSQSTTADSGSGSIKLEDFLSWCNKIPEDKLKKALDFSILHVDAGR